MDLTTSTMNTEKPPLQTKASQRAHSSTRKTFSYMVGFDSVTYLRVKTRYVTSTSPKSPVPTWYLRHSNITTRVDAMK
eukprot:3543746-Ditylum_brightwellii.AAC.1